MTVRGSFLVLTGLLALCAVASSLSQPLPTVKAFLSTYTAAF
jgi:hypothetical protein